MSLKTYPHVSSNFYDRDGNRVGEDSPAAYEERPIVDIEGEEVELIECVGVDWKATPDEVMEQVNAALESMGVEFRFIGIDRGDDSYVFGAEEV
jgi:hypothetical protein